MRTQKACFFAMSPVLSPFKLRNCWPALVFVFAGLGCGDERGETADSGLSMLEPDGNKKDDEDTDPEEVDSGDEDPGIDDEPGFPEPKFDMADKPKSEGAKNDKDGCSCEPNSDLIYVLGDDKSLMLFDPGDLSFKDLGAFECPFGLFEIPFSLGVDRESRAWIQTRPSAKLYRVDTLKDNACTAVDHKPGSEGIDLFGMAFVDKPNDGSCERLYMHSFSGGAWSQGDGIGLLGVMEPEDFSVKKVGKIDYNGGELTGTQDGRLFAFAGEPAKLVEYKPKTAEVVKVTDLEGLTLTNAFAFAFWGGDFYFFTEEDALIPTKSKVTHLDYDGDGSIKTVVEQAPIHIVGAGVSVCAPLDPPPK